MARCAQCGATNQSSRYCADCGASLGGGLVPLVAAGPAGPVGPVGRGAPSGGVGGDGPGESERTVTTGPKRPGRRLALVAVAAAVVAAFVVADRAGNVSRSASPSGVELPPVPRSTPLAAASSVPAPDPNPADPGGPTGSPDPGWPASLAVPPVVSGTLLLGFADGSVGTLDLAGGALRRIAKLDLPLPSVLAPLGPSVLVYGDGGAQRTLRLVSPSDSTVADLGFEGWVQAARSSGALIRTDSDLGPESTFLAPDGTLSRVALPPRHEAVAVAGGQVLVAVQGRIARFDPTTGALAPVADGEVLGADDVGLVRVVCAVGGCELRAGPWQEIDRLRVPLEAGHEPSQGQLTPDGERLLLIEDQPSGAPRLFVVDLRSGSRRALAAMGGSGLAGSPAAPLPVTADGRYVIESGGLYLTLHPLDGSAPLRVGPLPEPVIAAAMA